MHRQEGELFPYTLWEKLLLPLGRWIFAGAAWTSRLSHLQALAVPAPLSSSELGEAPRPAWPV